ncbi:hypothetical protein V7127_18095 [Bacillus sp. JJ1773]|uniref:hypothetical protein n=1 Tax=Bacillus sp. JJ1773 TaxID=3122965 RepID=UPI002FFEA43E
MSNHDFIKENMKSKDFFLKALYTELDERITLLEDRVGKDTDRISAKSIIFPATGTAFIVFIFILNFL